jgi:hypothetical protein
MEPSLPNFDRQSLPATCEFCGTTNQVSTVSLDDRWTTLCSRCFEISGLGGAEGRGPLPQYYGRPIHRTMAHRKGYDPSYSEIVYQDRPRRNPLNIVMNVSKLTLRLEKFLQILSTGQNNYGTVNSRLATRTIITKLLDRTAALPAVPKPQIFGMYLENFVATSSVPPYSEMSLPVPVLGEITDFYLDGHPRRQELSDLTREIHSILRSMTLYYIEKHIYNKTVVYRSLKQFLGICRSVLAAAYATPTLFTPYFSECLSGLDKFCWKLQKADLNQLTIPRWAALKEDCDLPDFNVYRTAALEVALIVSGYAGSVLPQFAGIRDTMGGELGKALDDLRTELDPFNSDDTWMAYALLLGQDRNYFMWEGHL